jgi:cardiolipin synthase
MSSVGATATAPSENKTIAQLRALADQAFSRAAGAPLVEGNNVSLLRDAKQNYPAWLDAIRSAKSRIHFESYIIHSDAIGQQFAEALAAKAREGVRVRLIYDWLGALGAASFRFWRPLRHAGLEVRCFNPPQLDSPFGWLSRDHRKMLSVDSRIAFVTGLCVGDRWTGDENRGIEPWRDTGVAIEGPAVVDIEQAFATMWATLGSPITAPELPHAREALPSRRSGIAGCRQYAQHRWCVSAGPVGLGDCPPLDLVDRRLLRRNYTLR